MDQLKVKDRILENISLSVKKLQSYFAACEDETPAIRNHDRVLQRLCEHLDHALLYGLQDISSGYWVLVLHFTRREAVRQIEELQHIATNLGRSRAWLYLALSESSLESYLRLFQENQGLLHKYYFKNALVCSHDHLTLFLTLVSGLEFIRFDLELDVPYLDVAPYMPEYYKPHNLPDFEERLPSSDSLSLHSFTSLTSTNLEWDDSAIAPSSEDYDFGDIFPVLQSVPGADWEEGDLTDPASGPRSSNSDPPTVVSVSMGVGAGGFTAKGAPTPRSPTFRHNPFNEDSDTATSADVTPVHTACRHDAAAVDDTGSTSTELEVIRMARRRKPGKKRRGKGSVESTGGSQNASPPDQDEGEEEPQDPSPPDHDKDPVSGEGCGGSERFLDSRARRGEREEEEEAEEGEEEAEGLLRLPEMTDTSMDSVGQPLREVMDRLNGALDGPDWEQAGEEEEEEEGGSSGLRGSLTPEAKTSPPPPQQQPFRGDAGGEPPDPAPQTRSVAPDPNFLQAPPAPADFYRFALHSPDSAAPGGGHHDTAGDSQPQAVSGGHEDEGEGEGEAAKGKDSTVTLEEEEEDDEEEEQETQPEVLENGSTMAGNEEEYEEEEQTSPTDTSHPAEFSVDNNHLLLLMIHVFRENEEQLYKMVRMSTGHMEGDLQPLYLLLTDCYIYLLRKGAAEKPYTVEEAVSYNELDYISVGLDKQTVTLVCTNRRRQFLLDTADSSLTDWFLAALRSAMIKGCREPPYPSVLTDATMEKLALTKFVSQESHCEVSEVCIQLYSLVHWEDPMDVSVSPHATLSSPLDSGSTKEGPMFYRAGTTYLGKELWKSCYLVLSNGILYQYPERTDVTPLLSITMGGEHCGGCRRSNSSERPHAFQVILTDRPPLELSAENEQDMADWMQLLCQSVSKGVIPQGAAPTPCIPCCLVVTDRQLLTCHQDCQTSFFRSLGGAELCDVTAVRVEREKEYCVIEFAEDRAQFLPPWVLYFSSCEERDRLLAALERAWKNIFQVCLPQKGVSDPCVQKRCGEALALMRSAWQRSDSLHRGRSQREPWC
ncbi:pleckstrin homology domain-containing family M member 2 isoform X1 [Megalops cyprinoides]|uniref:pleckstrin homology domain-containing family M member 2 isoform X1 n=1 Tax=Megalops cyprinoides TaxID=118141 RepID=UPI0018649866|nr:pleckstrin homology domain-containing family M member 2 isoform X1 [Megalops cyprinoides]XP_036389415.1 pleckstrin homology domain-containing family M member 2 isoform X1 [Megalops cyprinoides]